MIELDKIHEGVVLDGKGWKKDSREIKKMRSRTVKAGSTEDSRVISFDDGNYYVAAKKMESGSTDISYSDVRFNAIGDVRYNTTGRFKSFFKSFFR